MRAIVIRLYHKDECGIYKGLNLFTELFLKLIHGKNSFVKVSKNLARYKSENNFVER